MKSSDKENKFDHFVAVGGRLYGGSNSKNGVQNERLPLVI